MRAMLLENSVFDPITGQGMFGFAMESATWVDLAYHAVQADDLTLAEYYLNKAFEITPISGQAHLLAGIVYDLRGDTRDSRKHWQRYLTLDPSGPL